MRYFLQSMANICLLIAIAVPYLQSADPVKKDPAMLPAMLPTMLSAERIFSDKEFDVQDVDLLIWSERSASYFTTVLADGSGKDESNKKYDVVRVDVASGKKELVIPAALLMPAGETKQLPIDGMTFSRDETKLLIYTNSQRVWRKKTRGDYWVLNLATKELKKLGGEAKPSTLQFAKFSSDGSRVAYVRENNIYAQNTSDLRITSLTTDGTAKIVNGTGDWVNEEELAIVDAFRWSPDGQSIAFWQFDTTGVPEFHLLDNTAGLYPLVTTFAYPKVGQVNSAVRLGVVNATGGDVRWLAIPGDPRQHYVAEMGWTADSKAILLQQLNRRQNTNLVMLADAKPARRKPL
jgi:dipeptidyl-peptidase-4